MLTLATIANGPGMAWPWVVIGWSLHVLAFLLVTAHCLKSRREPTSSLLWIFIAWFFPVIGPLLYLAIGVDRVPDKGFRKYMADQKLLAERQAREKETLPLAYWRTVHEIVSTEPKDDYGKEVNRAMNTIVPDHPLLAGNEIKLLVTGEEAYPCMLDAIREAKEHIHLQSFIIKNDAIGEKFMDLLAKRAEEGITVRLLYDHFGSTTAALSGFFRKYRNIPNLRAIGWTQANLLKKQFQINLRNHRKIMVVDGSCAFVGGINLHRDNVQKNGKPPIRDYHCLLRGPIVQDLQYTFLRDWYFMTEEDPEQLLTETHFPHIESSGTAAIRLINSSPASGKDVLVDSIFMATVTARSQILIVTAYFVPTRDILRALRSAAFRGVDVKLVVPKRSNHIYAGFAGRAIYEELLEAGVRIFERHPPFMHAKAMIVDDAMALVGTANMDVRSFRLNYETNLTVYDQHFINELKHAMLNDMAESDELVLDDWRKRPTRHRIAENLAYLLMPQL